MNPATGTPDLAERHQLFLHALAQRDGETAMRRVRSILADYPHLTGKYCAVTASILARQGQFELAARLYLDAVAFDPDDTLARLYLGIVLQKLGRDPEARAHWTYIGEHHPERPEATLQLALVAFLDRD